jgi:hypothetical protein
MRCCCSAHGSLLPSMVRTPRNTSQGGGSLGTHLLLRGGLSHCLVGMLLWRFMAGSIDVLVALHSRVQQPVCIGSAEAAGARVAGVLVYCCAE